jgi:hypothetical protein
VRSRAGAGPVTPVTVEVGMAEGSTIAAAAETEEEGEGERAQVSGFSHVELMA